MEAYLSLLAFRRDGLHSFEHSSRRPRHRQHPQPDLRRFCLRRHSRVRTYGVRTQALASLQQSRRWELMI